MIKNQSSIRYATMYVAHLQFRYEPYDLRQCKCRKEKHEGIWFKKLCNLTELGENQLNYLGLLKFVKELNVCPCRIEPIYQDISYTTKDGQIHWKKSQKVHRYEKYFSIKELEAVIGFDYQELLKTYWRKKRRENQEEKIK